MQKRSRADPRVQGCWRALLWRKLQTAGIANTKFVGTLPAQGCGFTYDGANEGHGGILATGIVSNNQLPDWLSQTKPDVVMMHLGTNDVWNNRSPDNITAAFGTMVDQMRSSKPTMKILVSGSRQDCTSSVTDVGADEQRSGRPDHTDEPAELPTVRRPSRSAQQSDSDVGGVEEFDCEPDHSGGLLDGLQRRHGHGRRGASQ